MGIIRHILTTLYPQERGCDSQQIITYPETISNGNFVLYDDKSCLPAVNANKNKCKHCEMNILSVDTSTPIHILHFDNFLKQFKSTSTPFKGDNCDYILYDDNENIQRPQIAFCELTCQQSQYVNPNNGKFPEGKRAKAYKQIKNTIEQLLQQELLCTTIINYSSKIGIFAWREELDNTIADKATKNMEIFSKTPSEESPLLYNSMFVLEHNFTFIQIKHPNHFQWEHTYI